MSYTLIFLDTETTGNEEKDRLCQIAFAEITDTPKLLSPDKITSLLFKPPLPISVESSAVCHITNKMVADKPPFIDSETFHKLKDVFAKSDVILVAHNAKFDLGMLRKEGIEIPQNICTLRVARALDTEGVIPRYNLQYLRYYLGIEIDATAHDAKGDVMVLFELFKRLFVKIRATVHSDEEAIKKMLEISSHPSLITTINFGKHNGKKLSEVVQYDPSYLDWLLVQKEQSPSDEEDWIYTLKHYLRK